MENEKKDLKQFYSCKRKPDVVTAVAISLFLIVILLQIYLIVFLPLQLKEAETLEYNVSRDELLQDIDFLRGKLIKYKAPDELASGESQMLKSAFDRLMLYTRENRDGLALDQVGELSKRIRMFTAVFQRWQDSRFYLREETLEQKKYIRILEKRILEQEKLQQ